MAVDNFTHVGSSAQATPQGWNQKGLKDLCKIKHPTLKSFTIETLILDLGSRLLPPESVEIWNKGTSVLVSVDICTEQHRFCSLLSQKVWWRHVYNLYVNSANFVDLLLLFSDEKSFIYDILTFPSSSAALLISWARYCRCSSYAEQGRLIVSAVQNFSVWLVTLQGSWIVQISSLKTSSSLPPAS